MALALGLLAAPAKAQAQAQAQTQIQNPAQPARTVVRNGDHIAAVVNQEAVTAGEIDRRIEMARTSAARGNQRLPAEDDLRRQVVDSLIDERVIISSARDSGMRVDEADLDRAVQSIAAQNRLTLDALRQRLREEGTDYGRFRANLRDQIMIERLREREVYQRIRVSDEEIDAELARQRAAAAGDSQINVAQVLVTVAEGADEATVAARRERIDQALKRIAAGEAFEAVAKAMSEDGNRERGGEIGMRPVGRLPDLFIDATKNLAAGQFTREPVRSGAGFHVLKVVERRDGTQPRVTQTRARHVLLRTSPQLSAEVASRRLAEYRADIEAGRRTFEDVARQFSEDASSVTGGDLGWSSPGVMVPEFETAMNTLAPGGLSAPVVSRFGVHLIQVLERRDVAVDPKQLREQARNVLREQKFEQAYLDWAKELRSRAYIEMREAP